MIICLEIWCNCFSRGQFDPKTAPHQDFLRKQGEGFFYDEQAINELATAGDIYESIAEWKTSICTHEHPLYTGCIKWPDGAYFIKEDWANILPEDQYKNLILLFSRGLDFEFRGAVIKETLAELNKLKQATFTVVQLLHNEDGRSSFVAVAGIDRFRLLNSLGRYSSYLDHEGFSIVKVSGMELLNAEFKLGIPMEGYLRSPSSPKVFNANRFRLDKRAGLNHYTNINSGQSFTTPSNMASGYDHFSTGVFEVKYLEGYKIIDNFEVLPQLESVLKKALELDGWLEAW